MVLRVCKIIGTKNVFNFYFANAVHTALMWGRKHDVTESDGY